MRINHESQPGHFQLMEQETVIGRVRGPVVTFVGFRTRDAAARAAEVAFGALHRHAIGTVLEPIGYLPGISWLSDGQTIVLRADGAAPSEAGQVAEVHPPSSSATDGPGWRIDVRVAGESTPELFVLSRARVMWRAIQGHGLWRQMCQFPVATDRWSGGVAAAYAG